MTWVNFLHFLFLVSLIATNWTSDDHEKKPQDRRFSPVILLKKGKELVIFSYFWKDPGWHKKIFHKQLELFVPVWESVYANTYLGFVLFLLGIIHFPLQKSMQVALSEDEDRYSAETELED